MKNHELDELRFGATEVENHYIDEYMAGRLSRSALLKLGTGIGMSMPAARHVRWCGRAMRARRSPANQKAGGNLRVGQLKPAIAVDPVTSATQATLARRRASRASTSSTSIPATGTLKPEIATAWKTPDGKGKSWVFTIRQGVKFNDGTALTADDVVATFKRLADPANNSAALSGLKDVGWPRRRHVKTGPFEMTVKPKTPEPVAALPDRLAALPGGHPAGELHGRLVREDVPGHGPVQAGPERLHHRRGRAVRAQHRLLGRHARPRHRPPHLLRRHGVADPGAAGRRARPDRPVRLPGGPGPDQEQAVPDLLDQVLGASRARRCASTCPPFNDKNAPPRAGARDQPARDPARRCSAGRACSATTRRSHRRRRPSRRASRSGSMDLAKAKQLAAGKKLSTQLTTQNAYELPDLAVLIQNAAKAIGYKITPKLLSVTAYYAGKQQASGQGQVRRGRHAVAERASSPAPTGRPRPVPNADPHRRLQDGRHLERVALLEQVARQADRPVHVDARPRHPALARGEDRQDPARRHAGHPALLLQLPRRQARRTSRATRPTHSRPDPSAGRLASASSPPSSAAGASAPAAGDRSPGNPPIVRFLLKRLGLSLITLWLLSIIVFAAAQLLPGDVGRTILGHSRRPGVGRRS